MKLKDTGLTQQEIKDKVNKYMIETYERFDFLAETAKDQYIYDENGEEYLDFDPHILKLVDAKKVALACALIHNPNIIILDDYTSGLGYKDKKDLERLLKLLKTKYNKIIILLTKDTSFAYDISDEIYLMHATRLIASKADKTILRDEELLKDIKLQVPPIVSFINACNKKGHEIYHYTNTHDLIKGVYRDVF